MSSRVQPRDDASQISIAGSLGPPASARGSKGATPGAAAAPPAPAPADVAPGELAGAASASGAAASAAAAIVYGPGGDVTGFRYAGTTYELADMQECDIAEIERYLASQRRDPLETAQLMLARLGD